MNLVYAGNKSPEVLFIMEPGSVVFKTDIEKKILKECIDFAEIDAKQIALVRCAHEPEEGLWDDKAQLKKYILTYRESLLEILRSMSPKAVVCLGGNSLQAFMGARAFKPSDYNGQVRLVDGVPVIATSSLQVASTRLDSINIFRAECAALKKFRDSGYIYSEELFSDICGGYKWCVDLTELVNNPPKVIAFDTETTGLDWKLDSVYPFVAQLTWEEGQGIAIPLGNTYFPEYFSELLGSWDQEKLLGQLKTVLENPNTKVVGHNIKFDMHMISKLGIEITPWMDTMQLLHAIDENSLQKNLDVAVKQYVGDMYGYADSFNRSVDKSNMISVPPDKLLGYACGDTDATFRLCKTLYAIAKQDPSNLAVLHKVRMPAIKSFYLLEKQGICIDTNKLPELVKTVEEGMAERHVELITSIPREVLLKHAWTAGSAGVSDNLRPTNSQLIIDALFSESGLGLTPKLYTNTKEPSLSAKDHLSYFEDEGIKLIELYIEQQKVSKLSSTYIGDSSESKGLYKYIHTDPRTVVTKVHTSFSLLTDTGRSSSKSPNVQNLPQGRGSEDSAVTKIAKAYKGLFSASEGYSIVEIDYSQAEVRLAAWASGDEKLLEIYRNGLDVYRSTAANVMMGISLEEFMQLPKNVQKNKRQGAKAVVLGFLYGMLAKKFGVYAKLTYGVEFTKQESEDIRTKFFQVHKGLAEWHAKVKLDVAKQGYVKSILGATRHLPGIKSSDRWVVLQNERNAINSPIQGDASNFGLIALDLIYRDFPRDIVRPVNFVHDALYFEVKRGYEEEYAGYLKWYMENIPLNQMFGVNPPLPLIAECSIGDNFRDKKEIEIASVKPSFCSF